MIGMYNCSIIGRSHRVTPGSVCQDASGVVQLKNGWGVAAVADGVGSAERSEYGSKTAVEEILRFLSSEQFDVWNEPKLIETMRFAYRSALSAIEARADADYQPIHKYDTTLTCVIYDGKHAVWGHVGDGGIIALSPNGIYTQVTKVQKGEMYNEVVPLQIGEKAWVFGSLPDEACALLLMTDGIYDCACPPLLAHTKNPIYVRFVRVFVDRNVVAVSKIDDFPEMSEEVKNLLNSEKTEAVKDDMTVAALINLDCMPECREAEYYATPNWVELRENQMTKLYPGLGTRVCETETSRHNSVKEDPLTQNECESKIPCSPITNIKNINSIKSSYQEQCIPLNKLYTSNKNTTKSNNINGATYLPTKHSKSIPEVYPTIRYIAILFALLVIICGLSVYVLKLQNQNRLLMSQNNVLSSKNISLADKVSSNTLLQIEINNLNMANIELTDDNARLKELVANNEQEIISLKSLLTFSSEDRGISNDIGDHSSILYSSDEENDATTAFIQLDPIDTN